MTDKHNQADVAEFLDGVEANEPKKRYAFDKLADLIAAMNKEVALAPLGRNMAFVFWNEIGDLIFRNKTDAEIALARYQYVAKDKNGNSMRPVAGFSLWLKSERRREYKRVVFAPGRIKEKRHELNLWTGWGVKAAKGDWSLLKAHILDNICQGDADNYHFLMSVLAQMFQEPMRKIGICIGLQGDFGVGKSKLSDWLGYIVRPLHAPAIDKPEQLTGRFTGQLENALLARVEEGFYPGDPGSKAALKHIITSKRLLVERKGFDAYDTENFTRVLITSNSDWMVPAGAGERRYFILKVGDARKKDGKYFAAIDKQMEEGGAEAFLDELLTYDYSDVDFSKPPMTDGLQDQIRLGFTPEERWWESVLSEGEFPYKDGGAPSEGWEDGSTLKIEKGKVLESFRDFVPGHRSPASMQMVGTFLSKNAPGLKETKSKSEGKRHWTLPLLADLRAAFIKRRPGYVFAADASYEKESAKVGLPNILYQRD